jgi:hypothetical protein
MKKVIANPFLEKKTTIKTGDFQKFIFQDQYKGDTYIRSIKIDKSALNVQVSPDLLFKFMSEVKKKNTIVVFLYLISCLRYDSDIVILNTNEIQELTGYQKSTIYAAIKELISLEVISKIIGRGNSYKYFINPLLVFSGMRIDFIQSKNSDLVRSTTTTKKVF